MQIESHFVSIDDLRLHYLAAGEGEPILLLHGWPTSSFLWRHVMPSIARRHRVLALDLPGFGKSDKPLDVSYSFRYFSRVLDGFLDALGHDKIGLAVHDLGGPIGLYWACHHPQRLRSLALLNTLVYPKFSSAVMLFILAGRLPVVRSILASPWGLEKAMFLGIADARRVTPEVLAAVQAPFAPKPAREALLRAGTRLSPKGFREIAELLPTLRVPVQILYGEKDRILPKVARTMAHVQRDLPQAVATSLPGCGHFLQEDNPEEIGEILADFFAAADNSTPMPNTLA